MCLCILPSISRRLLITAQQDWTAGTCSQANGVTTIYASRLVDTNETRHDRMIAPGSNRVIIAYGATDTVCVPELKCFVCQYGAEFQVLFIFLKFPNHLHRVVSQTVHYSLQLGSHADCNDLLWFAAL
jgi:hypothetical protein